MTKIEINQELFNNIKQALTDFQNSGGYDLSVLKDSLQNFSFKITNAEYKHKTHGSVYLLSSNDKLVTNAIIMGDVPNLYLVRVAAKTVDKFLDIIQKKRDRKALGAKTQAHYFAEREEDE